MALLDIDKRLIGSRSLRGTATAGRNRFGINRLTTGSGGYINLIPTTTPRLSNVPVVKPEPVTVLPTTLATSVPGG